MKKSCRRCGATGLRRINRTGFLQRSILPLFGIYPWECAMCRKRRFLRDDGKRAGVERRARHSV